jgi:hypothetical protein
MLNVTAIDTISPLYMLGHTNISGSYPIGTPFAAYYNWTDNYRLGYYVASWWNTTHWQNTSDALFSAGSNCGFGVSYNCSGVAGTLSAIGVWEFKFFANDSLNNWNVSPVLSITAGINQPPQVTGHSENATTIELGQSILLIGNFTDDLALSGYYLVEGVNESHYYCNGGFKTDYTECILDWSTAWSNCSSVMSCGIAIAGTPNPIGTHNWSIFANDSTNQWNNTGWQTWHVFLVTPPNSFSYADVFQGNGTSGYGYFAGQDYLWQDAITPYNSATRGITNIQAIPLTYDIDKDNKTEIILIDNNQLRVFSGPELNIDYELPLVGTHFKHYALVENMTNASTSFITISEGVAYLNKIDFYWNGTIGNYSQNLSSTLTNYAGGQMVYQCDTNECVIVYNEKGWMDYVASNPSTSDELYATWWKDDNSVRSPIKIYNSTGGGILCLPNYRNMEIVDYMGNGTMRAVFPFIDSNSKKMRVGELNSALALVRNGSADIGQAVAKDNRVYCDYNATAPSGHSDISKMVTNVVIANIDTDPVKEYLIAFVTSDYTDSASSQDFQFYMWNGSLASTNNYDDGILLLLKTDNNGIPGNLFLASPNVANDTASKNMAVCSLGYRGDTYGGVLCFSPYYKFSPESTEEYFSLFRDLNSVTYTPGTWANYGSSGQQRYMQLMTDGRQNYTGGVNPTEFILNGADQGVWDIAYTAADNGASRHGMDFSAYPNSTFVAPIRDTNGKYDIILFDATNLHYLDDLFYDNAAGLNSMCVNPCMYYPTSGGNTWLENNSVLHFYINGTDLNNLATSSSVTTALPVYSFLYTFTKIIVDFVTDITILPSPYYMKGGLTEWGLSHLGGGAEIKAWYIASYSNNYSARFIANYTDTQEITAWTDWTSPFSAVEFNFTNMTRVGEYQGIIQLRDQGNGTIINLSFPLRVGVSTSMVTVAYGDCQWCTSDLLTTPLGEEEVVNNSITTAAGIAAGWTGLPVKILWLLLMLFVGIIIWVQGGKAEPSLSAGIVVIVELILLIAGWKFHLISGWVISLMVIFGLIIGGAIFATRVMKK